MRLADRLARWRVTSGFAFGAAVLVLAAPTRTTLLAGIPIALTGEGLRLWAAGHLNKAREVTSSGPYRWFAHPLYVGSSVIGAGLAVASGSVAVAVIIAVYLAVMLTAAIRSEEAYLRQTFGDRYNRYRRGEASARAEATSRPFRWAQAMANREHRTLAGIAIAVLLLVLKATYNGVLAR